jgi:predicted RNase H-like nuclease (RuvC/YqgF family)
MEITLEAIISFIGLFVGGGAGAFFTWRYQRKKAKAEAEQAEVDAEKDKQDYYQQLLEDYKSHHEELRSEREHYKNERNELRDKVEKMDAEMRNMKRLWTDKEIETDRKIAQLGRRVEAMRPFLCGDLKCKKRQLVTISDNEANEKEDVKDE